ncbi:MAG: T9SS type A sorting domain-containing protein [Bacteroidales bacterium]|nr:T9SS type A sorting domain-containing protein [Bacteroidales bacterium]
MVRKVILVLLLLQMLGVVQAQRFEWAKGYASSQQGTEIKGQVADREGNLYILGTFRNDARWDGEPLLPMVPYGYQPNNNNVLIAKISPTGQMLWKKVIHSNAGLNSRAYDIKSVGDTAFACLVQLSLSRALENYLYYLDTLIVGDSDYPLPTPYFGRNSYTTYLQFDFEGQVQEQHFLQVGYLDAEGNDLVNPAPLPHIDPTPWYVSDIFYYPSFDVDAAGNIYISRMAMNMTYCCGDSPVEYSVEDGTISAVKYWVDHRLAGVIYIDPHHRPQNGIPELLVFSPHFDTLLTSRYLFEHYVNGTPSTYLRLDRYGDLYALGSVVVRGINDTIVVDAERGISFPITEATLNKGYLVKLDSALTPIYCVALEDSVVSADYSHSITTFKDVAFDYDSNLLAICINTGRSSSQDTSGFHAIPTYRGIPLNTLKNDVFFLLLRINDGGFYSYGRVPSLKLSHITTEAHGNIVMKGNRVFMQGRYMGGIRLPEETIRVSTSTGLQVFDYAGNIIGGLHYNNTGTPDKSGPITVVDSIVYLANLLTSPATFGDIAVPYQGYHACIARYVDTAFMTPYRAAVPADTDTVSVVHPDYDAPQPSIHPNPAADALYVSSGGMPLGAAAAISVLGMRQSLPFVGNVVDVSSLPPGVYIMEIIINNIKYNFKFIKL